MTRGFGREGERERGRGEEVWKMFIREVRRSGLVVVADSEIFEEGCVQAG